MWKQLIPDNTASKPSLAFVAQIERIGRPHPPHFGTVRPEAVCCRNGQGHGPADHGLR